VAAISDATEIVPALTVTPDCLPALDSVMRKAGRENFTVASALLGAENRRHLLALYGFARLVDDVGDEVPGNRLALLDALEAELERIYGGGEPEHPAMVALAASVRQRRLPQEPFRRLIEANRRDQVQTRYETFEELLDYCRLSAAPVGELVLHVFGAGTRERISLSDHVCAGLQIVEHLQDVEEDFARGRIYLPRADMERFGCEEADLLERASSPALRALIGFEAQRARALLARGAPLARSLAPRPRLAVAGFVAGGRAALDAVERESRLGLRARPRRRRCVFVLALAAALGGR
jgi:squalene synthase HpnC